MTSLAEQYGLPATIPINDAKRQAGCKARSAELASIEGDYAIYRGVCDMKHAYTERVLIKKIKEKVKEVKTEEVVIENGEIKLGAGNSYQATELEEL